MAKLSRPSLMDVSNIRIHLTFISKWAFSVNIRWTACGFVCNVSISLSFPAPTSSTDLNSNNDKTYKVTPMIESLRTTQIAFFKFATPSGFLGGGDEVQKVFVQGSVQGKILWNHLWEHRFSVPHPRVFPPPEDRIYNWAVITETMFQTLVFTKTTGRQPGWGHCYLRSSQLHLAC